jgi:hypothetical protein
MAAELLLRWQVDQDDPEDRIPAPWQRSHRWKEPD